MHLTQRIRLCKKLWQKNLRMKKYLNKFESILDIRELNSYSRVKQMQSAIQNYKN